MARELQKHQLIERSLIKKYRKELWNPFIACVKQYRLAEEGDRIAVAVNDLPSQLAFVLLRQLQRVSDTSFAMQAVAWDEKAMPPEAVENAAAMQIEYRTVTGDEAPTETALLSLLGCNKLAYGTCRSDVAEAVLTELFYHGRIEAILPETPLTDSSTSVILPLYGITRQHILAWANYNTLSFVSQPQEGERFAAARILGEICRDNPDAERNIVKSLHAVCRDTFPGYIQDGAQHSFLERFQLLEDTGKK